MKFVLFTILILVLVNIEFGQPSMQASLNSDYCSLFKEDNISKKFIKTKVLIYESAAVDVHGRSFFFYHPFCNNEDFFADFDFSKLKDLENKWGKFFHDRSGKKDYIFEAEIEGNLTVSIYLEFGDFGFDSFRASMELIEIKSIKDVTSKTKKPVFDAKNTFLEKIENLIRLNETVIFYLFDNKDRNREIDKVLSENYQLVDSENNIFNYQNFTNLTERKLSANFVSRKFYRGSIERSGNIFKITGKISISLTKDEVEDYVFKYENTFELSNDKWVLIKTTLSKI